MEPSSHQIKMIMCNGIHNKLSVIEFQKKMYQISGINLVSYDAFKVFFRKFKHGNFDIEDGLRSGRTIEVDCQQLKQIIDQVFQQKLERKFFNMIYCVRALELKICQKNNS